MVNTTDAKESLYKPLYPLPINISELHLRPPCLLRPPFYSGHKSISDTKRYIINGPNNDFLKPKMVLDLGFLWFFVYLHGLYHTKPQNT